MRLPCDALFPTWKRQAALGSSARLETENLNAPGGGQETEAASPP